MCSKHTCAQRRVLLKLFILYNFFFFLGLDFLLHTLYCHLIFYYYFYKFIVNVFFFMLFCKNFKHCCFNTFYSIVFYIYFTFFTSVFTSSILLLCNFRLLLVLHLNSFVRSFPQNNFVCVFYYIVFYMLIDDFFN